MQMSLHAPVSCHTVWPAPYPRPIREHIHTEPNPRDAHPVALVL